MGLDYALNWILRMLEIISRGREPEGEDNRVVVAVGKRETAIDLKRWRRRWRKPVNVVTPITVCSHQTRRGDTLPYKVNVETRIGQNLSLEKPATRFDWQRDILSRASSSGFAARHFRWSLNIRILPRHSRDDRQSAFTPWVT